MKSFKRVTQKSRYTKMYAGFITKGKKNKLKEDFEDSANLHHYTPHEIVHSNLTSDHATNEESNSKINKIHRSLINHYHFPETGPKSSGKHVRAIHQYTQESGEHGTGYKKLNKALYKGNTDNFGSDDHKLMRNLKGALTKYTTPHALTVYSGVSRSPERHFDKHPHEDHVKAEFPAFTSTSLNREAAGEFSKQDEHSSHKYDHTQAKNIIATPAGKPFNSKLWDDNYKKMKDHLKTNPPKKLSHDEFRGQSNDGVVSPSGRLHGYNPNHVNYEHVLTMHVPKGSHGAYVDHHSMSEGENEFVLHHGSKFHIDKTPAVDHINRKVHWKAKMVHDGVKDVSHLHEPEDK